MRINLKTLGCRLNEAELETWARQFQADGHQVVGDTEEADMLVFNSCAVTGDAVRKSRNLLRKAARENPGAKIVMSGCYATLDPIEAQGLGVDLVVANQDKERLVEISRRELALQTMPVLSMEPGESALYRMGRHRGFVKVQDGCRYRCTYCIVTLARGEERSRPIQAVVDEINALYEQGIQEAVLTGVHLGGYGSDSGSNLAELIEAILRQTRIPRLRLGSLEPWDIPPGFMALFNDPRLMPHLHLPLQSGSDRVLRRMARRCRTGEFAELAARLREQVPDINITTDIIVGFPGETEAEWAETLSFVESIGFGHIHIFSYSARTGTVAAGLPDRVPGDVMKRRHLTLHELSERQKQEWWQQQAGRIFPVLWEGLRQATDGTASIDGYTPNYIRVRLSGTPLPSACEIRPVRLLGPTPTGDAMLATLAED